MMSRRSATGFAQFRKEVVVALERANDMRGFRRWRERRRLLGLWNVSMSAERSHLAALEAFRKDWRGGPFGGTKTLLEEDCTPSV